MSLESLDHIAFFWALFLTTPGPNAISCVIVSAAYGLRHGLICMLAILTQADLFLTLSGFGIIALLSTSSLAFLVLEWIGAGFFYPYWYSLLTYCEVTVTEKLYDRNNQP